MKKQRARLYVNVEPVEEPRLLDLGPLNEIVDSLGRLTEDVTAELTDPDGLLAELADAFCEAVQHLVKLLKEALQALALIAEQGVPDRYTKAQRRYRELFRSALCLK